MPLRFYTEEQLGPTRFLTPDGFLLCQDVPLARTGHLLYANGEIPIEADGDGLIRISRDEADVFADSAILSFAGKPVTSDHPPVKVSPANWKDYAIGVVLNPRRGDGRKFDIDYLYGDLLITDETAIKEVLAGKREVSAGYDAEYSQLAPGSGQQKNIIGNHVALVAKGRCGPTCSIGDSEMAAARVSVIDRMKAAFYGRDAKAFDSLVDTLEKDPDMKGEILMGGATDASATPNTGAEHTHIHLNMAGGKDKGGAKDEGGEAGDPMNEILARLEALEQAIAVLANGSGGEDSKPKGKDAAREVSEDEEIKTPDKTRAKDKVRAAKDESKEDEDEDENKSDDAARETDDADEDEDDDKEDGDREDKKERIENKDMGRGYKAKVAPRPSRAKVRSAGRDEWPDKKDDDEDEDEDDKKDKKESKDTRRASVGDSTSMRESFNDVLARAELLSPGIKLPTFDAKTPARTTFDTICNFRRKALEGAMKSDDTKAAVEMFLGGDSPKFAAMSCDSVAVLFNGASEVMRGSGGGKVMKSDPANAFQNANKQAQSIVAQINERNHAFYKR